MMKMIFMIVIYDDYDQDCIDDHNEHHHQHHNDDECAISCSDIVGCIDDEFLESSRVSNIWLSKGEMCE